MLVVERVVEGVRVGSAVRRVEDEVLAAARLRLLLDRAHQELADSTAPEALPDDERGHFAPGLVALEEILDMEGGKASDLALELGDDGDRGRIAGDALEALGCLLGRRRVPELAEEGGDRSGVLWRRLAKGYGGGGGASRGGPSSSTYVLLRPHPPP